MLRCFVYFFGYSEWFRSDNVCLLLAHLQINIQWIVRSSSHGVVFLFAKRSLRNAFVHEGMKPFVERNRYREESKLAGKDKKRQFLQPTSFLFSLLLNWGFQQKITFFEFGQRHFGRTSPGLARLCWSIFNRLWVYSRPTSLLRLLFYSFSSRR